MHSASARDGELVDVAVVGARCAGSAAAIALARAGRRVVALDRVAFPADANSTHLLWPAGVAELKALGAFDRVRALGAPPLPVAIGVGGGYTVRGHFTPVDGIDHAWCVRRTGLDAALVETAREAGAEVRERTRVTAVLWDRSRAVGVRYEDAAGAAHELRASLVVGADGRRSTVAGLVGARVPYRSRPSGRACFYAYWNDGRPDWRHVAAQWRVGAELGTAFPCDAGLVLVLLQPPRRRTSEFAADREGVYLATVASISGLAERLDGSQLAGKVRSATDLESYFRRSSGPGWALAGDAGHFKDPVTAQGIRDALRFGRLLGESAAATLDEPRALDAALATWERRRELECLETYQWTDALARGESMTLLERELYRHAARTPPLAREMLDVFSRTRRPAQLLTARRLLRYTATAALRQPELAGALARETRRDLRTALRDERERHRVRRERRSPA